MATRGENPIQTISNAVKRWAFSAFNLVNNAAKRNLSGVVLNVRTGRLRNSLDIVGRPYDDGFKIGTNVKYGIAWEKGFTRPAYTILPVNRKALHFFLRGSEVFAKSARIPQKTFAARPFLRPTFTENRRQLIELYDKEMITAVGKIFPGGQL